MEINGAAFDRQGERSGTGAPCFLAPNVEDVPIGPIAVDADFSRVRRSHFYKSAGPPSRPKRFARTSGTNHWFSFSTIAKSIRRLTSISTPARSNKRSRTADNSSRHTTNWPIRCGLLTPKPGGSVARPLGRVEEAKPLLAGALATAREHARLKLIAYVLGVMAQLSFRRGDILDGRAKYAEAIALYESIGADRSAAVARLNLAEAAVLASRGNTDGTACSVPPTVSYRHTDTATVRSEPRSGNPSVRHFGRQSEIVSGSMRC